MTGIRPLLSALVLSLFAGTAWAVCPSVNVQFEDSFAQFKPTWGDPTPEVKVENGSMILSPASGTYAWRANTAGLYDDVDMCVTVTTQTSVDPADAKAGVIFWYTDVNNFYVFEIAPNGAASVWRRQRGKWLAQVKWTDSASVNKGDSAINELRVTTAGSDATLYINGTEFKKMSGTPPEKGQEIGLFAASPEKGQALFAFEGLRVTKP
jgi:hypothetical protein